MALDSPKDKFGNKLPPLITEDSDNTKAVRARNFATKEKNRKAALKQKADRKKEANRPKDSFGRKLPPLVTTTPKYIKDQIKRRDDADAKKAEDKIKKQKVAKEKKVKKAKVKDISELSNKKYYDASPKKVEKKKEKKKAPSVSFGKAFADARGAGKKTFMWNGKSYNTKRADDKPAAAPTKKLDDIAPTDIKTTAELGPLTDKTNTTDKKEEPKKEMTRVEMGKNQMNAARKSMGMKKGGAVKKMKKCRMDGIALRGKTRAKQRSK